MHELIGAAVRRIADGVAATFAMTAEVNMTLIGAATVNTKEEADPRPGPPWRQGLKCGATSSRA